MKAIVEASGVAKPSPPFPWMMMIVDQDGDGSGAFFDLSYEKQLRLAILRDPVRTIATNLELAFKHYWQWLFVLMMTVVYNLHWGSWVGCRWQHEGVAAVQD